MIVHKYHRHSIGKEAPFRPPAVEVDEFVVSLENVGNGVTVLEFGNGAYLDVVLDDSFIT